MLNEYRPDFVDQQGLTILEHTERNVLLGRWKPLSEQLRRRLEAFHGKRVISMSVDPRDPAIRLAIPVHRTPIAPDPERDRLPIAGSLHDMGSRTRNLPPGEELLRRLVTTALAYDASDLGLWRVSPFQWRCTVRTGGLIHEITRLDERAARTVLRLFKLYAGLDSIQERVPQDGRVEFPWLPGRTIRVATVGDFSGEALAIRFLDRSPRPLGALGFDASLLAKLLSALSAPAGLVLCSGPTGSGKTTTIAAMAEVLARSGRKVVSVEDPVEYRIPGVLQLETRGSEAEYLPAALRQDPDVLWIGEVRRRDHVPPLTEALLSGHLVLTTVHAAGNSGAFRRLVELGVPPDVLRDNTVLMFTQTLTGDPPQLSAEFCEGYGYGPNLGRR